MHTFTQLSSDFQALLKAIHHVRKAEKGTYLFQEGTEAAELYIVISGIIQVSKVVSDGRELTLQMCSNGDLIGDLSLFSPSEQHLVNAKVLEDAEVAVIFREELEEKLSQDLNAALEFVKWTNQKRRIELTKFYDFVLFGKKGALYSILIRLSSSYGKKSQEGIVIKTTLTNQELANFCGTSREVISRLLGELKRKNVITVHKGVITIHDLDYLRSGIDSVNYPSDICLI